MNQLELTNEQYKQKYLKYKKKYLDLQVELEGKGSIERETGARNLIRDFKLLPVPEIKIAVLILLDPVDRAI